MTDNEIRVAIAEACGYKYPCPSCFNNGYKDRWRNKGDTGCLAENDLPDFPNDLNAIHEVCEATLTGDQKQEFAWALYKILTPGQLICLATARQQAEAFLRTVGKWKD